MPRHTSPSASSETPDRPGAAPVEHSTPRSTIGLVPIFGTLLSLVILGEAFHAYHAVAMAMVLGGIWIAERSGSRA